MVAFEGVLQIRMWTTSILHLSGTSVQPRTAGYIPWKSGMNISVSLPEFHSVSIMLTVGSTRILSMCARFSYLVRYAPSRRHSVSAEHRGPHWEILAAEVRKENRPVQYNGGNTDTNAGCVAPQDVEETWFLARPSRNDSQQGNDRAQERQFGAMLCMDESNDAEAHERIRELQRVARAKVRENIDLSQRIRRQLMEISGLERKLEAMKNSNSYTEWRLCLMSLHAGPHYY